MCQSTTHSTAVNHTSSCLEPTCSPATKGIINAQQASPTITNSDAKKLAERTEPTLPYIGKLQAATVNQQQPIIMVHTRDIAEIILAFDTASKNTSPSQLTNTQTKKLTSQLQAIHTLLKSNQGLDGRISTKNIALISLHFENIANTLPHSHSAAELKELASLLSVNLTSAWAQQEKVAHIAQWTKACAPKFIPGASSVKDCSLGVSTEFSALSIPGAQKTIGPYLNLGITGHLKHGKRADDDGALFVEKSVAIDGKVSAGVKAKLSEQLGVGASGAIQYSRTNAGLKIYASPKEYAQKEGHKTSHLSRQHYAPSKLNKLYSAIKSVIHAKSEMQRINVIHQKAVNTQSRLSFLLNKIGVKQEFAITKPDRSYVKSHQYHLIKRQAKAEANATLNAAGLNSQIGGSIAIGQTYGDIWVHIPKSFSEAISQNSQRLAELPPNYYQHAKALLDNVPAKYLAGTAMTGLELLESDIESYFEHVKQYDYLKSQGGSHQTKLLATKKHQIEQRWGANGRHQFIQFAAASHAYLSHNFSQNIDNLSPKKLKQSSELISSLAQKIYQPDIQHSPKRLDKLVNFNKQFLVRINDTKTSINISAGPLSGTLDITYKDRLHPNPLREGKFVDVSFTLASSINAASIDFVKQLNDKINSQISNTLTTQGITEISKITLTPDASAGISGAYMMRFFKPTHDQYQGETRYRKQFSRFLVSTSANVNVETGANVAPGVKVGANIGVKHASTRVVKETLGTDDLTFPTMMFKRFFDRNGKEANNIEWQAFTQQHLSELTTLIQNLGNENKAIYRDAQTLLKQQIALYQSEGQTDKLTEATAFQQQFTLAMKNAFSEPHNPNNIKQAFIQLTALLESQVPLVAQGFSGRLEDKALTLTAHSGLNLSSAIINKLSSQTPNEPVLPSLNKAEASTKASDVENTLVLTRNRSELMSNNAESNRNEEPELNETQDSIASEFEQEMMKEFEAHMKQTNIMP